MKHVHHDMIVEWAKDTSRVVELLNSLGKWTEVATPSWRPDIEFRFKPAEPKYIVVNGVNVPEPVRKLKHGQEYWLALVGSGVPAAYQWSPVFHHDFLAFGLIHLTREAAQAHIDAMLLPSRTDK